MLTIEQYIQTHNEQMNKALQLVFPKDWDIPATLLEAMTYSMMAGGKRMRPILVIAAVEALGGSVEAAIPVACALEMIHTYSLVHDDLPAMDNDDYRRGKLTNHKVYGEDMAILAGDALLTHAFYSIIQSGKQYGIASDQVLNIVEECSRYAGAAGMVGGQVLDMEGEQGLTSIEQLINIHNHKTSDLIVCSLRAGGHLAGASESQLQALEQFGRSIGLAFQIQDDILDVVGDEAKLGKPINSDEKMNKVTYPFFMGIEPSRQKVKQLTDQGKEAILNAGFSNPERLIQLADFLMNRDH
jgi:geranylgeranyl diphosphate synthase type II